MYAVGAILGLVGAVKV
ncbi:hypothetical protein [Segetibacter koreensis]